jgi:hypothetical protein
VAHCCASKPDRLHDHLEKWNLRVMDIGSVEFESIMACHKMVCGEESVVKLLCELSCVLATM